MRLGIGGDILPSNPLQLDSTTGVNMMIVTVHSLLRLVDCYCALY